MSQAYVWPVRVYYEDTDHGGVVYYANYLKFMERCRTEFLRARGLGQDVLIEKNDLIFAVRRIVTDYIKPATFNDLLLVTAEVNQKSRVKIVFKQQVFIPLADKELPSMGGYFDTIKNLIDSCVLLCEAEVTIASLSASKMQPKRIPENIFEELMREH